MENKLRILAFWVAFLALTVTTAVSWADGPDSGFFIGGGGNLLWTSGSGTWSIYDFEVTQPLSTEEGGPVGLAWTDKMQLGVKPMVGYKINDSWALQVAYGLSIPKSSQQIYSETNGLVYYEQGLNIEWKQRDLELVGIFYPDTDLAYYFFGGVDVTFVDTKITLFENAEYPDESGNTIISGDYQIETDDILATGFILGAGLEFAADDRNTVVYLSAQYCRSMTDDAYFSTEDFKVDVGGISFMVGVKWYPFDKVTSEHRLNP